MTTFSIKAPTVACGTCFSGVCLATLGWAPGLASAEVFNEYFETIWQWANDVSCGAIAADSERPPRPEGPVYQQCHECGGTGTREATRAETAERLASVGLEFAE